MLKYTEYSDELLMEKYKEGDEKAFFEIYQRYSKYMYGYFIKRTGNTDHSDDLLQLVFYKIHKSKNSYNKTYHLKPWIFTICRNALVDYKRNLVKYKFIDLEEWNETAIFSNFESDSSSKNLEEVLENSILNEENKELLQLRFVNELSYDDLSSRFNISSILARKRVSRAVSKLKKALTKKTARI